MQIAGNRFFFFICFFLFCRLAIAQQQMGSYMAYGPEAKYFSNLNYSVYQSKNGYLWFGTSSGLVRFDGKRYKNYFSDYANPNSLSDNTIFDIAEDKNDDLWFAGFEHGVTKYNQHTGKFTKYPALSKDNNPYYGIRRIVNDAQGNLWFATAGRGLAAYDFEKDTFNFYYPNPDKPKDGTTNNYNQVTDIAEDKTYKNILWVGTQYGLFSFDKVNKKFTFYSSGSIPVIFSPFMGINDIEPGKNGLLWLGTYGNGLHCFDTETKKYLTKNAKKIAPIVYDLKMINDSILYAACLNEGLYQLNIHTGQYANISPPRNTADSTAKSSSIQKVSITPDAGIFIGGNYYVYQQHPDYVRLKKTINYPDVDKSNERSFLNSCVWDENRKQYWLATDNYSGLYTLDKDLLNLKPLSFEHTASQTNRYFYQLTIDALNRVWVLHYHYGIYLWDETKKVFTKPFNVIPLPDSVIKKISDIKEDRQGNIWMFSSDHFIYWHIRESKIETFPLQWNAGFKGSHNIRGGELKVDPDGNAWLLTRNGMFHCIRQQKKVNHIFKTGNTINDLSSSIVLTGAFNKYNDLWITNGNGGLQVINRNDYSVLANHTINDGLPSMIIRSINADTLGRIWAGTTSGLGLFNPKNNTWRLFNRFDGMQRDYLDNFVTITKNNKIVIDQNNSILIRDINELMPDIKPPLLHITSILINNKAYQDSGLPEFINELVLPYHQNNIDIEFAAMDWVYPFKTYYSYFIEGVSSENDLSVNQSCKISLVSLQPGKYVLHIKALSGNGVPSKEIIFPITIKPPFWKTWWFITFCILLLASILYGLYRYRINRFIEMQNVRNSISRDLHDEIGATLSSVNMLSAVALIKAGKENDATPIIQQIKDSVQLAGESMDDIVWSVNPIHDIASDTFARIRKYITEMTEAKGVNCIIEIDDPGTSLKLPMELRRDIYMVCKEAVNNALKYSGCTEIKLNIHLIHSHLHLSVADNGRGFNLSVLQNTVRNGIGNMEHRIKKHNGIFELRSGKEKGTIIDCKIPL
jgi:ligand-binding sensor domain-containing protein/two-component sensor histidine kinase